MIDRYDIGRDDCADGWVRGTNKQGTASGAIENSWARPTAKPPPRPGRRPVAPLSAPLPVPDRQYRGRGPARARRRAGLDRADRRGGPHRPRLRHLRRLRGGPGALRLPPVQDQRGPQPAGRGRDGGPSRPVDPCARPPGVHGRGPQGAALQPHCRGQADRRCAGRSRSDRHGCGISSSRFPASRRKTPARSPPCSR